jgi:DNA-binding CsgD family transcriptional regulator
MQDAVLANALEAVARIPDPEPPWTGILDAYRRLVGGDSASFIGFKGHHLVTCETVGADAAAVRAYQEHFYAQDVLLRSGGPRPAGSWLDTDRLHSVRERASSEYHVDFMDRFRMRQMVCFLIEETQDHSICMTVHRETPLDDGQDESRLQRILQVGSVIREQVARREAAASTWMSSVESAFGALGEATALVTHQGVIVRLSPNAAELMDGDSALRQRNGRLWHASVECRDLLAGALLRAALVGTISRLQVPDDGVRAGCSLEMVAADPRLRVGREKLIFMRIRKRRSRAAASAEQLAASFGVTQAEARVWAALIAGQAPKQYAEAHGVSINTVRKQIATLMEKIGCTRQVDLVRKGLI